MKKIKCLILVFFMTVLAGCGGDKGYLSIKVLELVGIVTYDRGGDTGVPVYDAFKPASGDAMSTDTESSVTLGLDDSKAVFVEENSRLLFESTQKDRILLNLEEGAIVNEIETKLKDNESYEVKTPNSLMAVRGTRFRVSTYVGDDGVFYTRVSGVEGRVECQLVYSDGNLSEVTVITDAGNEAIIYYDEKSETTDFVKFDNEGNPNLTEGENIRPIRYEELPRQTLEYLADRAESGVQMSISAGELREVLADYTPTEEPVLIDAEALGGLADAEAQGNTEKEEKEDAKEETETNTTAQTAVNRPANPINNQPAETNQPQEPAPLAVPPTEEKPQEEQKPETPAEEQKPETTTPSYDYEDDWYYNPPSNPPSNPGMTLSVSVSARKGNDRLDVIQSGDTFTISGLTKSEIDGLFTATITPTVTPNNIDKDNWQIEYLSQTSWVFCEKDYDQNGIVSISGDGISNLNSSTLTGAITVTASGVDPDKDDKVTKEKTITLVINFTDDVEIETLSLGDTIAKSNWGTWDDKGVYQQIYTFSSIDEMMSAVESIDITTTLTSRLRGTNRDQYNIQTDWNTSPGLKLDVVQGTDLVARHVRIVADDLPSITNNELELSWSVTATPIRSSDKTELTDKAKTVTNKIKIVIQGPDTDA